MGYCLDITSDSHNVIKGSQGAHYGDRYFLIGNDKVKFQSLDMCEQLVSNNSVDVSAEMLRAQ